MLAKDGHIELLTVDAKLPTLASAVPMTYMAGGRQYVAIAAGGTSRVTQRLSDALVVFALPES